MRWKRTMAAGMAALTAVSLTACGGSEAASSGPAADVAYTDITLGEDYTDLTTIDRLKDYVFHTPEDPGRSVECVAQRCGLIRKNLEFLRGQENEQI